MTRTFALVGVHGFGRLHLQTLSQLSQAGRARLIAVADPQGIPDADRPVPCYPDLTTLLQHHQPEVVVIATPIHTHAALAMQAINAGAHVLLEKPPTACLAEFNDLAALTQRSGRVVQVGFQSFGSSVLPELATVIEAGTLGTITGICGIGTWSRDRAYYQRSRWAGRRTMDGIPVMDGVVTNPLAHAVATGLLIDQSTRLHDVAGVEVDLYRAHDIEADDTSAVRITTTRGTSLTFALTLCASTHREPEVIVMGSRGQARVGYTEDRLTLATDAGEQQIHGSRTGLIQNLLDHLDDRDVPLLAPLESTGAFMRVLEAVRLAPDPIAVNPDYVQWHGDGDQAYPVIADIDQWCYQAATQQRLFRELKPAWIDL